MNILPDYDLFKEVAIDMKSDPSFIEKDWYATKIMAVVNTISSEQIRPVFCGGTSLSKCYKLLERFSEDLDYRGVAVEPSTKPGKGAKSRYRKAVIQAINEIEGLTVIKDSIKAGGNFFKFDVDYEKRFPIPDALRQNIKIEFSFSQPRFLNGFTLCNTRSFVDDYLERPTSSFVTECVSPVETAADKLSALTWRIIKREEASEADYDPSLVRHLHDLFVLRSEIKQNQTVFVDLIQTAFETDSQTPSRKVDESIFTALSRALSIIANNPQYKDDYQHYVESMSFADDIASWECAFDYFQRLVESFADKDDKGFNQMEVDLDFHPRL